MISPWGVYYITGVECNKLGTSTHIRRFFYAPYFPPIVSFVAFLRLRFISNHLPSGAKARIRHITILTYVIVTIHHATFNAMMLHLKGIFFSYLATKGNLVSERATFLPGADSVIMVLEGKQAHNFRLQFAFLIF